MYMNKEQIINSIFYPRNSHIPKGQNDHLIDTDDGEKLGIRFFLQNKTKIFSTSVFEWVAL